MFDILKKIDAIENKTKLNECGPMPSAEPSTPVTVNLSAPSAQDMAHMLRALANIESGQGMPPMVAMSKPMSMPAAAGAMEAEYEADEAFVNEPDEQYADHKFMTKDLSGGINREKNMYKPAAKGDNPMAVESIKDRLYAALNEKKATKDFDGDGKVEKSSDEWKGSRDKAIKKAMGKKTNEGIANWRGDDVDPQIGDMVELYASYDDGTPIRGKIVGPGKRGPKTFAIKFKNMLGKVVVDTFSAVDEFEVIKKATNEAKKAKPDFLDMDKDGNKKEPMKKAVKDKKKNPFKK